MPPSDRPTPPPRRAFRFLGLALAALLALGLVLAVAAQFVLPRIVDAAFVERRLNRALAGASDGLYEARIADVRFNVFARATEARGVRLAPRADAPAARLAEEPILYDVALPHLRVEGVGLWAAVRGRGFSAAAITADSAEVRLTFTGATFDEDDGGGDDFRFQLGRLRIAGGVLELVNAPSGDRHRFEGVDFALDGVDSAREADRLLAADDVRMAVATIRGTAERGHYRYRTEGRAHASSRDSTLRAGRVVFEPPEDDGRDGPLLLAADALAVDGADWLALFSRLDYRMREARIAAPDIRLRLPAADAPAGEDEPGEDLLLVQIGRLVAEDGRVEVVRAAGEGHRVGGLRIVAEGVDSFREGGPGALPLVAALSAEAPRASGETAGGALAYVAGPLVLRTAEGLIDVRAVRLGGRGGSRGTIAAARAEGVDFARLIAAGALDAGTVRLGRADVDVRLPAGTVGLGGAGGSGEAGVVRLAALVVDPSTIRVASPQGRFEAVDFALRAEGVDSRRAGLPVRRAEGRAARLAARTPEGAFRADGLRLDVLRLDTRGGGAESALRLTAARAEGQTPEGAFRADGLRADMRDRGQGALDVALAAARASGEARGYAFRTGALRANTRGGTAAVEGLSLAPVLALETHARRTGQAAVRLDAGRLDVDGFDLIRARAAAPSLRLGTARLSGWSADVFLPEAAFGGGRPPGAPPDSLADASEDEIRRAYPPRAPRRGDAYHLTAFREAWPLRRTDAARAFADALQDALPTEAAALVAEGGRLRVRDAAGDGAALDGLTLRVSGLDTRRPEGRVLATRDLALGWTRAEGTAEAGLYMFETGAFRVSTAEGRVRVEGIRFEPTVPDTVITARARVRTDPTRVRGGAVEMRGVDFLALQEYGALVAQGVYADSLDLSVYIDRGLPPDPAALFPHEAARAAGVPFRVDTLVVRGARLVQRERAAGGPRPGRLVFADVGLRAGNLTNDPARMTRQTPLVLDFDARFGEAGPLYYALRYPLLEPSFEMVYEGRLGTMPIAPLNASLVEVAGIEVREGRIDSLLWRFEAAQDTARAGPRALLEGGVRYFYRDLDVALVRREDGGQNLWQSVLSFLANNLVVRSANQPTGDLERDTKGVRYLIRNEDTFFDVLYNSVLEGVINETVFFF